MTTTISITMVCGYKKKKNYGQSTCSIEQEKIIETDHIGG